MLIYLKIYLRRTQELLTGQESLYKFLNTKATQLLIFLIREDRSFLIEEKDSFQFPKKL